MNAWVPSWPGIVELAATALLFFGGGSWVSGKVLDRTWRDGYEQGADDEVESFMPVEVSGLVLPRLGGYIREMIGPEWDPAPTDRIARQARYHQALPAATSPAAASADELFAGMDDDEAFGLIRWEFERLHFAASRPYELPGWAA